MLDLLKKEPPEETIDAFKGGIGVQNLRGEDVIHMDFIFIIAGKSVLSIATW